MNAHLETLIALAADAKRELKVARAEVIDTARGVARLHNSDRHNAESILKIELGHLAERFIRLQKAEVADEIFGAALERAQEGARREGK